MCQSHCSQCRDPSSKGTANWIDASAGHEDGLVGSLLKQLLARACPNLCSQPLAVAVVGLELGRERAGLALQAGEAFRIVGEALGKELEGHLAAELGVASAVDLPHPSRAERGEHLEGAQARAGFEGHRSFRAAGILLPLNPDGPPGSADAQRFSKCVRSWNWR